MNKRNILGAALAGTAALVALSGNASATAGDTATISGGQSWNICVSTQTPYSGSRFTADITKAGFESQIVYDNFNGEACKTVKLDTGSYSVKLNTPMNTGNVSYAIGGVHNDTLTFSIGSVDNKYYNIYGALDYSAEASAVAVSFDANGGTGTMAAQQYAINTQVTLPSNTFTKGSDTFDGWNTAADGSGTAYADGATPTFTTAGEIKLYAQWVAAPQQNTLMAAITSNVNPTSSIDFRRTAVVSSDPTTANGNGINVFTENNQNVYYYRGAISDNNVLWGGFCWKMVRTTATGGIKMIYNGEPNNGQCTATGYDTVIDFGYYNSSPNGYSPADVGYMYGSRVNAVDLYNPSLTYTFSNQVSRSGNTYTLDTSANQSIAGTWASERLNAAAGYHYFCTDGATACDNTKIGYITGYGESDFIRYLPLGGYDDLADMKEAMFSNTNSSDAKTMIDSWFVASGLSAHESDLEDAVFCNDRTFATGALSGENADGTVDSFYSAYQRNQVVVNNNYNPSLDCARAEDRFTTDSNNGNGALTYKIGLITIDELTLAGMNTDWDSGYHASSTNYLNSGDDSDSWTMSPHSFMVAWDTTIAHIFYFTNASNISEGYVGRTGYNYPDNGVDIRPVVSLKSGTIIDGGAGTATDPYVIQ